LRGRLISFVPLDGGDWVFYRSLADNNVYATAGPGSP
jgi:hypothetical protein